MIGGIVIGLLCIAVFVAGGHPWSVTFGYTVWGAKIASALGFDFSHAAFWQWPGPKHALADSVLSDTSSLTDFGMLFGAMAAAAAAKPFAATAWPPAKSLLAAAIGGLLMGWGARLGFGCNIGAFVGGVASGSLHGWVWFAAALPRLRDRHPPAAAVRPVEGLSAMRKVYLAVVVLGLAAIVGEHLTSPSTGRAVRRRISPAPARPAARPVRRSK